MLMAVTIGLRLQLRLRRWGPILLTATWWLAANAAHSQPAERVFLTDVSGAIGVATTRQVSRAIEASQAAKAVALVVRLDTPGGLVSATREIIKDMIASPVSIVVYVAPSGARAASAGTFIIYASHIAAMAPGTNMGAATPVEIGGVPAAGTFVRSVRSRKFAKAQSRLRLR